MKKISIIPLIFLFLAVVSAQNYTLEFWQFDEKVVIREFIDGNKTIEKVDNKILEKTKEGFIFLKEIIFSEDFEKVKIKINLDYGFYLSEIGAFPKNYKTETNGQIISLVWDLENVTKNESFVIFAEINNLKKSRDYSKFFIFLGVIILFLIIYLLFFKKKKSFDENLLDDEKKVINYLKKCDRNEAWQKNIQKDCGFSKAKLSRLLRNLESRNLIKKIPFGNTNKVVLN